MNSDSYPHYYQRVHRWNGVEFYTTLRVVEPGKAPEAYYPSNGLWYQSMTVYREQDLVGAGYPRVGPPAEQR